MDRRFDYARESLLAYARWVRDREVPYRSAFDRVEYPTATWPAHDLRKGVVCGFAARHAPAEERAGFLQAAERFHDESLAGLMSMEGRACTRPQAIVLQNEPVLRALRRAEPLAAGPTDRHFGEPSEFVSQKQRVQRMLRTPAGCSRLGLRLLHPRRLAEFVRLAAIEARNRWR